MARFDDLYLLCQEWTLLRGGLGEREHGETDKEVLGVDLIVLGEVEVFLGHENALCRFMSVSARFEDGWWEKGDMTHLGRGTRGSSSDQLWE